MSSEAAEGRRSAKTLRRPVPRVMDTSSTRTAGWVERALLDQGMPPEEIQVILLADDPLVVRRHLELHRERLVEDLSERRRTLASLERALLAGRQGRRTEPSSATVQKGLWATSQGCPSGSTKTAE